MQEILKYVLMRIVKQSCATIIVPCYNEELCIKATLNELSNMQLECSILVIDDGSVDQTSSEASAFKNVDLIKLPVNLGVGGAVQTGLMYARDNGNSIAVKFDGDGQHDPDSIKSLLEPLSNGEADIVIGSRFLKKNAGFKSTFMRRIGIRFLQLISWLLTGQKITDPTSGFRAYNRRAIDFMSRYYPSFDYPEPEEIVLASKNGLKIIEVAVQMRERQAGVSTISSSLSVYYMLKVVLAMIFIFLRQPEMKRELKDV